MDTRYWNSNLGFNSGNAASLLGQLTVDPPT
jgi:hypothetical protein